MQLLLVNAVLGEHVSHLDLGELVGVGICWQREREESPEDRQPLDIVEEGRDRQSLRNEYVEIVPRAEAVIFVKIHYDETGVAVGVLGNVTAGC